MPLSKLAGPTDDWYSQPQPIVTRAATADWDIAPWLAPEVVNANLPAQAIRPRQAAEIPLLPMDEGSPAEKGDSDTTPG